MAKAEKDMKEKDEKIDNEQKKDKKDEKIDNEQKKDKKDEKIDKGQKKKGAPKEEKKDEKIDKGQKKKGAPKEDKKDTSKPKDEHPDIRHIIRISDSDLDGKKSVQYALTGIKGISRRIAKIISVKSDVDPMATLGYLSDADINRLQTSVNDIITIIPQWMTNKQNDFMTGDDRHSIGTDVMLSTNEDINIMKKMRSYKGLRHERGLKVRGQKTRSTGRKGRTVGVTRASLAAAKTAAKTATKEGEKKEDKKGGGK